MARLGRGRRGWLRRFRWPLLGLGAVLVAMAVAFWLTRPSEREALEARRTVLRDSIVSLQTDVGAFVATHRQFGFTVEMLVQLALVKRAGKDIEPVLAQAMKASGGQGVTTMAAVARLSSQLREAVDRTIALHLAKKELGEVEVRLSQLDASP